MSVRMSDKEFFDRCLLTRYGESERGLFGDPMDCYGMVYWYYRICLAVDIGAPHAKNINDVDLTHFEKVEVPKDYDIVYMEPRMNHGAPHVGIYIGGLIYHFTFNGLRVERKIKIIEGIKGYYRYVDACKNS